MKKIIILESGIVVLLGVFFLMPKKPVAITAPVTKPNVAKSLDLQTYVHYKYKRLK